MVSEIKCLVVWQGDTITFSNVFHQNTIKRYIKRLLSLLNDDSDYTHLYPAYPFF